MYSNVEALLARRMHHGLAAWFIREVRNTVYHLKLGSVEVPPIHCTRGIPQGTKWGPDLCKVSLSHLLAPVWESCQKDRLGYHLDIENVFIPFLFFCDNLFILAHSAEDFQEIVVRVRNALANGGWRLPDDRVEWQANTRVPESQRILLRHWAEKHVDGSFKTLGSMVNVRGACHADIIFKKQLVKSSLHSKQALWSNASGSRKSKMRLMFRVASSAICWSVGAWKTTRRDLAGLNGMLLDEYKKCFKVRRYWGESDNHFHQRVGTLSRQLRSETKLRDFDGYVLGRMYDYVGHIIRAGTREPAYLPSVVLSHRDRDWCLQCQDLFSNQGHSGRVHPWNFERPYHVYFSALLLDWKHAATNKELWLRHKSGWIRSVYGGSCSPLKLV